jgi:hypothetical protein
MLSRSLLGLVLTLYVTPSFAEEAGSKPPASANASLEQVVPGDHWTYQLKDEITGTVKFTRIDTVTETSNSQITVRFDADNGRSGVIVYDRSWNVLREGPFKYSPNDGTGFQLPLTLGAQWKIAIDASNSSNGLTFKRNGSSRVTAQEGVTTKAGTFQAFVVDTNYTGKNVQDPTLVNQATDRTWFSTEVNHWVKRSILLRQRGNIVQNNTIELTGYGHKQ